MTLCAAWIENGFGLLVSDSRISFPNHPHVDVGTKLSRIDCHIFPPSEPGGAQFEGEITIPIACLFSGSVIAAYPIRDHLAVVLQSLQFVPGSSSPRVDLVFRFAKEIFERIAQPVRCSLMDKGNVEIVLMAGCPVEKRLRSLSLKWGNTTKPIFTDDPVPDTGKAYYFGDVAAKVAAQRLERHGARPYDALYSIIESGRFATIGGNIQFGRITTRGLYLHPLEKMDLDSLVGKGIQHTWGALDFNNLSTPDEHDSLHPSYGVFPQPRIYDLDFEVS